jgi:hypothetical protein
MTEPYEVSVECPEWDRPISTYIGQKHAVVRSLLPSRVYRRLAQFFIICLTALAG